MWPIPSINNNFLSIACSPQELTCSVIKPTSWHNCYELAAHRTYKLNNHELAHGTLFNPTIITKQIQAFIADNNLTNSFCVISLTEPTVTDNFITLPHASPTRRDFKNHQLKRLHWDFHYLYPQDDGLFAFYVTGIRQQVLFQFTLLTLQLPIHLLGITSESMALLYLYKQLYGTAFRPARLAQDMQQVKHSLHELVSSELLRRSLFINRALNVPDNHNNAALRTALGLYLLGKNAYETN